MVMVSMTCYTGPGDAEVGGAEVGGPLVGGRFVGGVEVGVASVGAGVGEVPGSTGPTPGSPIAWVGCSGVSREPARAPLTSASLGCPPRRARSRAA